MRSTRRGFVAVPFFAAFAARRAAAQSSPTEEQRAERWSELRRAILPDRATEPAGDRVRIEAPFRALDAALVPVSVEVAPELAARTVWLVIDENPSPLAATVRVGPAGDLRFLATRVRVENYTYLHAVVEAADGRLLETQRFVRAAGGCAAPLGSDLQAARARMGRTRFRRMEPDGPGGLTRLQVALSHPNTSGLQRDQLTLLPIAADFVRNFRVRYAGQEVLTMESDISIAENPTLEFLLAAGQPTDGELSLEAEDSAGRRHHGSWRLGRES